MGHRIDPGLDEGFSNARTRIGVASDLAETRWATQKIFSHHYESFRELLDTTPEGGYLVVAVHGNRNFTTHARLTPNGSSPSTVIVGRHGRAHVRLDRDPSIALRHLMVRVSRLGSENFVAVLDLKTSQGFELDGFGPCESTTSDGALFTRVGSYTLMFLPARAADYPDAPEDAWSTLSPASVDDRRNVDARSLQPVPVRHSAGDFNEVSQINILPGATAITRIQEGADIPDDTVGVIRVDSLDGETLYAVTSEHLERGLLLGRYNRCDVGARYLADRGAISRVHLLILRDGDRILALDTASTNGTVIDGSTRNLTELGEKASIQLGPGNVLHWARIAPLDAVPLSQLLN